MRLLMDNDMSTATSHRNPFRAGEPIQDPADFAGREKLLQTLPNMRNVCLRGERGTGKTSLLLYLANNAAAAQLNLPKAYLPVYFNFRKFAKSNANRVWEAIAAAIIEKIRQKFIFRLDVSQKDELMELLLACPSILNTENRCILLMELPHYIAAAIQENNSPKMHVLNIVNTCMNHEGGLELLLNRLRFFDGKTIPFQTLTAFINKLANKSLANELLTGDLHLLKAADPITEVFEHWLAGLGLSGHKIHLLFDEFEDTLNNPELGNSFFAALHTLFDRIPNFSCIIATRVDLAALRAKADQSADPFFDTFSESKLTLAPFQEDEVRLLLFSYFTRAGVGSGSLQASLLCGEFSTLHKVTGYHPLLLQTYCYHLCERLDIPNWPLGQAREEALQAVKEDENIGKYFQDYWESSSEQEQEQIKRLVSKQPVDWDLLDASKEELKNRCLLVRAREELKWRLVSSAFTDWVNRNILVKQIEKNTIQREPSSNPFQLAGPLSADAPSYIRRACDGQLAAMLETKKLIALIGEFQIGKSSLLNRVMQAPVFENGNWKDCFIDFQSMDTHDVNYFMEEFFDSVSKSSGQKTRTWKELADNLEPQPVLFRIDEFGLLSPDLALILIPKLYWLTLTSNNIRTVVCLRDPINKFFKRFKKQDIDNPKYSRDWHNIVLSGFNRKQVLQLLHLLQEPVAAVASKHIDAIMGNSLCDSPPLCKPQALQCLFRRLFKAGKQNQETIEDIIEDLDSYQ